jgi:transposase
MTEESIIKSYNEGINAVISLVKDLNCNFEDQMRSLTSEINALKITNLEFSARIAELEARLNKNSNNSSKPPSTDGYKKKIKNNRIKNGRRSGGQEGHQGHTLLKVENPDIKIDARIGDHCDCGESLSEVDDKIRTRQEFELPKIKPIVTEYITHEKVCPRCGKVHKSEFPVDISQPTQYGVNMKAQMIYLTDYQLIPLKRAVEMIEAMSGQSVSQGTLVTTSEKLYQTLENPVEAIKQQIIESKVVHFDETGMRSEGKTKWLHVASTETLTYYEMHQKRGTEATAEIGILPEFKGTAIHDHWAPYYTFKDCTHGECNSHNMRYLQDIYENYGHEWSQNMASFLIELKDQVEALKTEGMTGMEATQTEVWMKRYTSIIEEGIKEDDEKSPKVFSKKTGKPQRSKALNLLLKLQEYDIETLAFMYDFDVPFDNNLAERDLRMQKLRQKISGCFRGSEGAKVFCRIRSYISTARKNGQDVMESLVNALRGNPFIPET